MKFVEITNRNINNENFENGFNASNLIFVFFIRGIYYEIEFCFNRKIIFTKILKVFDNQIFNLDQ